MSDRPPAPPRGLLVLPRRAVGVRRRCRWTCTCRRCREVGRGPRRRPVAVQLTLTAARSGSPPGNWWPDRCRTASAGAGPLLLGLGACALGTLLSAFAPAVWVLVSIRVLEGMAGARDRARPGDRPGPSTSGHRGRPGVRAARLGRRGRTGPRPACWAASCCGSRWRGLFVVLVRSSGWSSSSPAWRMPETLPAGSAGPAGSATTLRQRADAARPAPFLGFVLAQGFGFGALFTYISSLVVHAAGRLRAVRPAVQPRLRGATASGSCWRRSCPGCWSRRTGPRALLVAGLSVQLIGTRGPRRRRAGRRRAAGRAARVCPWSSPPPAWIMPNATALAMAGAARSAGTASALLGSGQFAIGGLDRPVRRAGRGRHAAPDGASSCSAPSLLAATAWLAHAAPRLSPDGPAPAAADRPAGDRRRAVAPSA